MAVFEEVQFPTKIAFGSSGGPSFSTNIITMKNGREQRNINWGQPRLKFNVAHGIKNTSDFDVVKAFFYARQGKAIGFRYKDWSDYQAIGQIIATADGTQTQFQLVKRYDSGAAQTIRNITKPIAGTLNIYIDSVLQISGVSIDYTTGIVTFSAAPIVNEIISTDFDFDVPVRFDSDQMVANFESTNTLQVQDIALIEVVV